MLDPGTFFLPVRELGARIRDRRLSPVELTGACLDRLERLGGRYHAVVTLMRASALREARAAEREIAAGHARGPLHGIPYGVKDLIATQGVPTTWGAAPYRHQVFDHDATVVERLREAGAILVAKLAMVELAGGMGYNHADASFTGPGLSPWNTRFWSGGSSSGPGAAVAAGLVPFAIGSETSGSILTPAAFCGVTGLRPTYGLVSRYGAMALSWTMDKLGPMCHSAEDCGLVLEAMAGGDSNDPGSAHKSFHYTPQYYRQAKDLRIGYAPVDFAERADPSARPAFEQALAVMRETGAQLIETRLPDLPYGALTSTIIVAEACSIFEPLIASGKVDQLADP